MKKNILLLIALVTICTTTFAQTRVDFDAAVNKFQKFYNQQQPDSVYDLFGDRIKSMLSLDKTSEMIEKLHGQFGEMLSNEFTKSDARFSYYKTSFAKGTLSLVVGLTKDNKLQNFRFAPYEGDNAATGIQAHIQDDTEKANIVLKTQTGNIYGILEVPAGDRKVPVVLIVAGSGPTDMNGNCPELGLNANTYRMLAGALLKAGIASLRYDKRGVGQSAAAMKSEQDILFDDMVSDAAGFIHTLKKDPRFSKVVVLGHSEGSLIGMMAAESQKAAAFISVAGLGEKADKIIEKQIGGQSKDLEATSKVILDSLLMGYRVKHVDPQLNALFRPTIQPYMISWLRYDPAIEIKKMKMPVYILQGTTDIQVGVDQAKELKKACPHAKLKIIPGMNHVLKLSSLETQENVATYSNPNLPLCPGLMPDMVKFIKQK